MIPIGTTIHPEGSARLAIVFFPVRALADRVRQSGQSGAVPSPVCTGVPAGANHLVAIRWSGLRLTGCVAPIAQCRRFLGRFNQMTNPRPAARRIKPPRNVSAIGAPVFTELPVDATGCIPAGSDDVRVPALSLALDAGVVVSPCDVVGDGESEGDLDTDGE